MQIKENDFTIDKYIQSLDFHFGKENLLYCLEHFVENRKNYTFSGKLKIRHANFSNNDIRGINLDKFDITEAAFSGTKVDKEQFKYILGYAKNGLVSIAGIDIKGLDLLGINLSGIDFSNISFQDVKLDRENINSLEETLKAHKINLIGANLEGIDLSGKNILDNELGFDGFCYFDLRDINFDQVNLQNADLSGAILNGSSFEGANLNNAKIIATYARYTNMKNASMVGAVLKHSDFCYSNFDFADLQNAVV